MCGIVGYIGPNPAAEVLLEGLQRLEYRGYDSAGLAVLNGHGINITKEVGKVVALTGKVTSGSPQEHDGMVGIAHTRWATHGAPTEPNAHPHSCAAGGFAVVHNGIIENYRALREQLIKAGHTFESETDSEIIPHLISEAYDGDFFEAVATALTQIRGTYGIAVICDKHPGQIIAARKGSPIVIGVGNDESVVASDVSAVVQHTNNVIYLDDGDIAMVSGSRINIRNLDRMPVSREISTIDWDVESAEKGRFEHFMLKEIFEQPDALHNTIRGRLDMEHGTAILSGLSMSPQDLVRFERVVLAACGTSMYAGMVGEYFFEDLANLPASVEQAAEFRYRNPILDWHSLIIAISQSGETADTLAALREAKSKGAHVAGLCNVVGSTIAREAGRGVYLHAGPEIGVASTKAFTCQVTVLLMMALKFARARRMPLEQGCALAEEINRIPALVKEVLKQADSIAAIAKKWHACEDMFFIGRGYLYPVALEGALKLKEISYVHAEGYHAAELKHGPIALLQENVPVFAFVNDVSGQDKVIGNVQECKARRAPVILAGTEGDTKIAELTEDIIWLPRTSICIQPILSAVAVQLLSYYIARERGCPIDQPRNLAKSVTVE